MSSSHSRLSPSSSERWLICTASVRMEQSIIAPPSSSVYADEGTRAHTRAELEAAFAFGLIEEPEYRKRLAEWELDTVSEAERMDMSYYAQLYVAFLGDLLKEEPHSKLLLEQRVDPKVPGCWGTADAVILGFKRIRVVDYKYGTGVRVDAEENSQTMLYGMGALEAYDVLVDAKDVDMWIFQPRLDHVSHYSISARNLRRWRDKYVIPLAEEALGEHGQFNPTEEACRWCPVAGECKPRMMKFTRMDFGDPDLMTPDDMAEALEQIPEIRDWCKAVEDLALDKVYSQHIPVPGYKAVRSAGRRSIQDHATAIKKLVKAGFKRADVSVVKTKTLGELERLVGKDELPEILGDLIVKPEGSISLVTEADKRPSISPTSEAQQDFAE